MSSIFAQTAKATFYNANGSGRDTYIYSNNGGLTGAHQTNIQPPIGTFSSPMKKHVTVKRPLINSKSIHYHSNGTGRDSYIMINQGGFQIENRAGEQNGSFYNGLRGYERNHRYLQQRSGSNSPTRQISNSKVNPFKDHLVDGQKTFSSGIVKHQLNALNQYQKHNDGRLSMPKYQPGMKDEHSMNIGTYQQQLRQVSTLGSSSRTPFLSSKNEVGQSPLNIGGGANTVKNATGSNSILNQISSPKIQKFSPHATINVSQRRESL
eukprot:403360052